DLSVRAIQNGQQTGLRWDMPFGDLAHPVARPAPRDSTHRAPAGPALWRRLVSRIGTVTADFSTSRSSSYTRLIGRPDFLYLFGLSDDPGVDNPGDPNDRFRMASAVGNQSSKGFQ